MWFGVLKFVQCDLRLFCGCRFDCFYDLLCFNYAMDYGIVVRTMLDILIIIVIVIGASVLKSNYIWKGIYD